jgi:hypothetical protein
LFELEIDLFKPTVDLGKFLVDLFKSPVYLDKSLVDLGKPHVHVFTQPDNIFPVGDFSLEMRVFRQFSKELTFEVFKFLSG